MTGTKRSSLERLATGSDRSAREGKPVEYVVHCVGDGSCLEEVVDYPYVHRNFSQHEIEQVLADPQLLDAARERLEAQFESGELDLGSGP